MMQRALILGLSALAILSGCQGEQPPAPQPSAGRQRPTSASDEGASANLTANRDDARTTASDDVGSDDAAATAGDDSHADEVVAETAAGEHSAADQDAVAASADDPADDDAPDADAESVGDQADEFSAELFHRWPDPQVVLVLSGEQDGYFEPCGCAGLENQKGGLSRRHTFLKQLRERGWEVLPLDLGGLVKRYGRQSEIKYHVTVEALHTMGYAAIGFGPQDLRLPVDELSADTSLASSNFVSANVDILGEVPATRIVEAGGRTFGITSILGEKHRGQVNNGDIAFRAAEEALAEVVAKLAAESDFQILLSYATPEESAELAGKFPQFDLVVTAGGADEPAPQPTRVDDEGAWLVEVGHKGMFVNVVGLFDDEEQPLRFQRVPLDKQFADSPDMHDAMVAYQGQLQAMGWEGLQVEALKHPSGREFAGSQSCGECHTKAFEIWSNTPHAHATQTLVDLDPPRHYDPECVSCHATGWEPQKYVPFVSGFDSLETTPLLTANGCENCHGPGADHVQAELGELNLPDAEIEKLRMAMRLPLERAEQTCLQCHDHDNSPDFEKLGFEHYWQEVEHQGTD